MTIPDVPHRFELTLEVPGTPEQVWAAIATAEGLTAWMMPTELEEREGGAVAFHMGDDGSSHGRITGWEPARRLAYEEDWASLFGRPGADVTPLATEFVVEATSGGTCVVRIVTSAFGTGADWEHEFFDDMITGWAPMLDNLRVYMAHFPGQRATTMDAGADLAGTAEGAIAAVRRELGMGEVGEAVDARGIAGVVERAGPQHAMVRMTSPLPGMLSFFAFGSETGAALRLAGYLFSDEAPAYAEREQARWAAWMTGLDVGAAASAGPTT
jgi:uncharacterized protein YndB with AHSA1/START domain